MKTRPITLHPVAIAIPEDGLLRLCFVAKPTAGVRRLPVVARLLPPRLLPVRRYMLQDVSLQGAKARERGQFTEGRQHPRAQHPRKHHGVRVRPLHAHFTPHLLTFHKPPFLISVWRPEKHNTSPAAQSLCPPPPPPHARPTRTLCARVSHSGLTAPLRATERSADSGLRLLCVCQH